MRPRGDRSFVSDTVRLCIWTLSDVALELDANMKTKYHRLFVKTKRQVSKDHRLRSLAKVAIQTFFKIIILIEQVYYIIDGCSEYSSTSKLLRQEVGEFVKW